MVAIVLVLLWAQHSPFTHDMGYLGTPRWERNPAAWGPVLAVCGAFSTQVWAVGAWVWLARWRWCAKSAHVFLQTLALCTMLSGLCATIHDKDMHHKDTRLTTIHAWVGVMGIAVFGVSYLWGLFMWLLSAVLAQRRPVAAIVAVVGQVDLVAIHRILGLTALWLTCLVIVSGIMDMHPDGMCNYILVGRAYQLPPSCQLANWLGVVIVGSTWSISAAVILRGRGVKSGITAATTPLMPPKNITDVSAGLELVMGETACSAVAPTTDMTTSQNYGIQEQYDQESTVANNCGSDLIGESQVVDTKTFPRSP